MSWSRLATAWPGAALRASGRRVLLRLCLGAACAMLLTACGFHVRSAGNFPPEMSAVYVDSRDRHSDFYTELTTRIRSSRLTLADSAADADTVILIISDETGRRPLSISGRNVPREYEVYYLVSYAVSVDGTEVMAPQQLVLTRSYTYDETAVLGKAREEEVLRRSLADDLVGLLVQQVSALN